MKSQAFSRREFFKICISASLFKAVPFPLFGAEASDCDVVFVKAGDASYSSLLQIFNKRIVKQPAVIALCRSEGGVQEALAYARKDGYPVAIRSGGHCFEGYSLNEKGMVIDLSQMNRLEYLKAEDEFVSGPASKLSDVYEFLLSRGRILPAGSCGGVGLAGLTLGGGYGIFSREFGLTCDSLTGLRMVSGAGEICDSKDRSELLWACRGGGNGNFGVVTQLRFKTYKAPEILTAYKFNSFRLTPDRASQLAELWFRHCENLPLAAFSAFILNQKTLTILVTTSASQFSAELEQTLKEFGAKNDRSYPPSKGVPVRLLKRYYGRRGPLYFKNASAGFYKSYDDLKPILQDVFEKVGNRPGVILQFNTLGGAITRKEFAVQSAFAHREFPFLGELQCYYEDPRQEKSCVAAVNEIQELFKDIGIRAHYSNYPDINFSNWPQSYYGEANYVRLQQLKSTLDPADLIRHPQSIRLPSGS